MNRNDSLSVNDVELGLLRVIMAVAFALAFAASCGGENLITNPGFEDEQSDEQPTGWRGSIRTEGASPLYIRTGKAGEDVHAGTHAAAIAKGGGLMDKWVINDDHNPPIKEGEAYRLSVMVKAKASETVRLTLVWLDDEGESIGAEHTEIAGSGEWKEGGLTAFAPKGAARAKPVLAVRKTRDSDTSLVAFDDVKLVRNPEPPRAEQETARLQQQIDQAIRDGAKELRIKPGTYRLSERLFVRKAANLTIDGTGVKLIVTVPDLKPIAVVGCKNLTVKGFTIDFDPLPFVQGPVTRIKREKGYIEVEVEPGYPDLHPSYLRKNTAHPFDAETGLWKYWAPNRMASRIKLLSPRKARIFLMERTRYLIDEDNPVIELGDLVVINSRAREAMAVVECENFTLEDTVFHTAAGIAILGRFGGGTHTLRNVRITPGPRPEGATHDRLISTCADGVNYFGLRGRLVVEGCEFSRMADDTLNLRAISTRVLRVEDGKTFIGSTRHPEYIRKDDVARFLAPTDLSPVAQSKLTSIEPVEMSEAERKTLLTAAGISLDNVRMKKVEAIRFHLADAVSLEVGQHVTFPAFSTPGFRIANNHFHDHRARGLRIQVSNGTIEDNRFERIQQAAITLGSEYRTDRTEAAGWSRDMVIRNNRFVDIGRGQHIATAWASTPAVIATESSKFRDIEPAFAGHRDIVIEGNIIDGCSVSAIHACAVDGLTIRHNDISNVNLVDGKDVSQELGMPPTHAISVYYCRNVTAADNEFSELGEHCVGRMLMFPQPSD